MEFKEKAVCMGRSVGSVSYTHLLREQVDNDELPSGDFKAAAAADERCISEAVGALTALGIPQAEGVRAVKEAASKADTAEEIIRIVLKGIDKF